MKKLLIILFIGMFMISFSSGVLSDDIVSYYQLDETSGTVIDIAGVNNGTNNGATAGVTGRIETAYNGFDAPDEIDLGAGNLNITGNMSISVWVFPTLFTGGAKMIVTKDCGTATTCTQWEIHASGGTGIFEMAIGNETAGIQNKVSATSGSALDEWLFVVGVFNETHLSIYLDGVLNATSEFHGVQASTTQDVFIGNDGDGTNPFVGTIDEVGIWERPLTQEEITKLYNDGAGLTFPFTPDVELTSPLNNSIIENNLFTCEVTFAPTGIASNFTLWHDISGTFVRNLTNTSLGGLNTTTFNITSAIPAGEYLAGCSVGESDGVETFSNNITFFVGANFTQSTFNVSTFETASETLIGEFENRTAIIITNPTLIYDGTVHTATVTQGANGFNISATIDIPTGIENKSFKYEFTLDGTNFTSVAEEQNVSGISYGLCNATLTAQYLNMTFRNETTANESITATINSIWNIWLGGGDTFKIFNIINSTEQPEQTFCFIPADRGINTNLTMTYNNNVSEQRSFVSEPILTNSSTNIVLYLLPSVLGLFTQFATIDIINSPIGLVKAVITRILNGATVTVSSVLTDSSGLAIIFLNPDVIYSATFTKLGFNDNVFTFVPTTDIRFVIMGSGQAVNGSNISVGATYDITPKNSTLTNDTLVNFGFNVSGDSGITFISMNITNVTGGQVGFQSNAGIGFISQNINTFENTTFIGRFEVRTSEENITLTKIWRIGDEYEGDYSISKQGRLVLDYEWADTVRFLIAILIMFGVLIFLSSNELADNNESKVAVMLTLVWIFSAIGWLDNPAVVATTGIAQFGKQYGIAILSTIAGVTFFMRRLFN